MYAGTTTRVHSSSAQCARWPVRGRCQLRAGVDAIMRTVACKRRATDSPRSRARMSVGLTLSHLMRVWAAWQGHAVHGAPHAACAYSNPIW